MYTVSGGHILGVSEDMSHLDFLTAWMWGVIKMSINNDSEVGNLSKRVTSGVID